MERSILIHYNTKTGEYTIEAEGFEGIGCLEATQPFEEALGVVEEGERSYKPEAAQNTAHRNTQNTASRLRQ